MKKAILTLLGCFIALGFAAGEPGKTVLAIQSMRIRPFNEAFSGFKNACDAKIESIVLMEENNFDVVNKLYTVKPEIILSIGRDALDLVKLIDDIPIIYLMVLNPNQIVNAKPNVIGVDMILSVESQLKTIHAAMPQRKRWGVIYNPKNFSHYLKEMPNVAQRVGLDLFSQTISEPKAVLPALKEMEGKIDGIWMLPDTTVITQETLEYLFLFSDRMRIPIVAFSEKYLDLGALMSIGIDTHDMGQQAGEMANKIFDGQPIKSMKSVNARKAVVVVNARISEKLDVPVSQEIKRNAGIKD